MTYVSLSVAEKGILCIIRGAACGQLRCRSFILSGHERVGGLCGKKCGGAVSDASGRDWVRGDLQSCGTVLPMHEDLDFNGRKVFSEKRHFCCADEQERGGFRRREQRGIHERT